MSNIGNRKSAHLVIVAEGRGTQAGRGTGLDAVRFVHVALPELDLAAIDHSTPFLGRAVAAPLMVSAMTGGPAEAEAINTHIAEACAAMNLPMSVGSQRVALEGRGAGGLGRDLRRRAQGVPLLANLGAVQLNRGFGPDEACRAVEMIGADALMLHLNPLQEAIQPGGDSDFSGLLAKIEAVARLLPVPLGVKEVGAGLSAAVGLRLVGAGVTLLDVAGVGGTSWARVEAERGDARLRALAAPFHDWGIPTAVAVADMHAVVGGQATIIASGGIRDGLDVARAVRLGADMVGQAAGVLAAARQSAEAVADHLALTVEQLRLAMFCTGSRDLGALRQAALLPG